MIVECWAHTYRDKVQMYGRTYDIVLIKRSKASARILHIYDVFGDALNKYEDIRFKYEDLRFRVSCNENTDSWRILKLL